MNTNKSAIKRLKSGAVLEIVLVISMTFAFAWIAAEGLKAQRNVIVVQRESGMKKWMVLGVLKIMGKIVGEKGLVSALDASDAKVGIVTCTKSKDGKICQQFVASECVEKCAETCLPSSLNEVAACSLGTCYDPLVGSCSVRSPKAVCESKSQQWLNDPLGNVPQCKKGCCVLGGQAYLSTQQQCTHDAAVYGIKKDFRAEVRDEISCIELVKEQEQGACVLGDERTCTFTARHECGVKRGLFYAGVLCSNPALKTNCERQKTARCVEGLDEVYWFDSCGNRENIYDSNRAKSWNEGRMLSRAESCFLGAGSTPLANQATCGNCNYLAGSICGKKTGTEKLADRTIDVVCRDLSCVDDGKKRQHGESWCVYQGAIGLDAEKNRGIDTPGSRHFRRSCIKGSITTEGCEDFRSELCVQKENTIPGGTFSAASCVKNGGVTEGTKGGLQCLEYNTQGRQEECANNDGCYVKHVEVSQAFTFDFCVPKYKPGFDLETRGAGAEAICKFATQSCTYIKVKGLFKSKEVNKECVSEKFAEQMNDFCMSLGDCGAQANYLGTLTENYKVTQGVKASVSYLASLKKYADEKKFEGQYAEPGANFEAGLGIPETLGESAIADQDAQAQKFAMMTGTVAGLAGLTLAVAAAKTSVAIAVAHTFGVGIGPTMAAMRGAGGVLTGAALGLTVTSLLLKFTGVGRGLEPAVTYTLLAAGAAGGALAGIGAVAGATQTATPTIAALTSVGLIMVVVVIVLIAIFKAFGVGKKKEIKVTFTCKPWQPSRGGADCEKCGSDGLPCGKYACQSLGQACRFINEDTKGVGECVAVERDDVTPPVIRAMKELLPEGYRAEESEQGVSIKAASEDGCIAETYTAIPFGLQLNEPGQCKMSFEHTDWEEMEDLAGRSLFLVNHSLPVYVPSLESLGLEGFDPSARADVNLYVRCQDMNKNKNEKEYAVNFCVKQGKDVAPPAVVAREPASEVVAWNATQVNVTVFTNEPAECRWDTQDVITSEMQNAFVCATDFEDRQLLGWGCSALLPVTKEEENYEVRCLDQPWRTDERNAATTSYHVKIRKSASPLQIDALRPSEETLFFATEPATVHLTLQTSGGVDGNARCFYVPPGGTTFVEFRYGAWTKQHKQVFNALTSGTYHIPVKCEDAVGNVAEKTASFTVELDSTAPRVTRVYASSGTFVVVTDEHAQCFVSRDTAQACGFDIAKATAMSGNEREHTTSPGRGVLYVKCKDRFENAPGECSLIARKG